MAEELDREKIIKVLGLAPPANPSGPGKRVAITVTIDVVVFCIIETKLSMVLVPRLDLPGARYGLPGAVLAPTEDIGDCAARAVLKAIGPGRVGLHQLGAFGRLGRDPRGRAISVAYVGIVTGDTLREAVSEGGFETGTICFGEHVSVLNFSGEEERLSLDHQDVVGAAARRLQDDLTLGRRAFEFLPDEFTLLDLQIVHEAISGRALNKPWFRKHHLNTGCLVPTGRTANRGAQRPAELYRVRQRS